jgi:hypothetical protein
MTDRPSSSSIRPAPVAVLRAAAWPMSAIQAFAAPAPEALNAAAEAGGETWRRCHHDLVERERAALFQRTCRDERFLKALALSSPRLALSARRATPSPNRNKRVRHLETALFRYLMRAAGRCSPFGAWAGVAPVRWAAEAEARAARPGYRFSPDLRPFQACLRALAAHPRYLAQPIFHVNKTLARIDDSRFSFHHTGADGRWHVRRLTIDPTWHALLRGLPGDGRFALATAAAQATGAGEAPRGPLLRLLAMVKVGVVCCCLDLPKAFATVWDALEHPIGALLPDHAAAWQRSVAALREICERLDASFETWALDAVIDDLEAASQACQSLTAALQLPEIAIPSPCLRADLRLPLDLTLDTATLASLATVVEAKDATQEAWGMSAAIQRALAASPRQPLGDGAVAALETWESLCARLDVAGAVADVIDRWRRVLVRGATSTELPAGAPARRALSRVPPVGCAIFDGWPARASTPGAARISLVGILDHVGPILGRLWPHLLHDGGGEHLPAWLARTVARHASEAGFVPVELVGSLPQNPNVLARPELGFERLDPLGCDVAAGGPVEVERLPDGTPFVRLADQRPAIAFSFTPAALPALGDYLARLLLTSFQDGATYLRRARSLSFAFELDGRSSPAVTSAGATIRRRRWLLTVEQLAPVIAGAGAERFLRWHQLARSCAWPALLLVTRDLDPPLVMPRDSALAVEALFIAATPATSIVVEEAPAACLEAGGERFFGELCVPFERESHAWSAVTSPAATPRSRDRTAMQQREG